MKKITLIETISDWLMSDNAGDAKGEYHPSIIATHLSTAFNQSVYAAWLSGKKYSDFSQLDAWSRAYPVPITNQSYALLPFAPVQLPDGMGLRQVVDSADSSNVFAPIEATANVIFSELEVNTMDDTPTYSLEQSNVNVGAGEPSHLLRLAKLPVAPVTLITMVDVMMVVGMENMDDFDEIACPNGGEDSLIKSVIDIMSKKPKGDTSNDAVNQAPNQ